MAIKMNIVIDQGSDYEVTVDLTDANNAPTNLMGFVGAAQMRKHYTSLNSTRFDVVVAANTGRVSLSMNSATSGALTPGRYVYDCELSSSGNVVTRIIEGIVTISPSVTR
jgi:hypothetical protein